MAPYSMDLRERVVRARDVGLGAKDVAAKYEVSLAWVNRVLQRRRETGSIAPRRQTHWREPKLAAHTERLRAMVLAQPDSTLEELRRALGIPVGLTTIWRALDAMDLTVKKNRPRRRTAPA
jgi:transposase